jgi:hypothetical protein
MEQVPVAVELKPRFYLKKPEAASKELRPTTR